MIQKWQQKSPNETPNWALTPGFFFELSPLLACQAPSQATVFPSAGNEGWYRQFLIASCPQEGSKGIWPAKSWEKAPSKEGLTILSQSWHSHGTRKEANKEHALPVKSLNTLSPVNETSSAGGLVIVDEGSLPGLTCT